MKKRVRGSKLIKEIKPIVNTIIIVFGILSGLSIIGGFVAIVLNAKSPTEFSILGAKLSTGHVGVAFVGLGLITMLFVVLAVLKNMKHLGDIKDS